MGGGEGFFLHGAEPLEPPGAHGEGDDAGSAKTHLNDHEPNSVSTDEVDTGIHVRTEDIQSLDEDSSSLRDYSDMDPDCEAMTRSCPNYERPDRERNRDEGQRGVGGADPEGGRGSGGDRSSPCPSSAPTLPRSHTMSPASSSASSGSGLVRMTSFAEQKFRKLEGRSSGGTTPESSDLNVPYTHSMKSASSQVGFWCRSPKSKWRVMKTFIMNYVFFLLFLRFPHHLCQLHLHHQSQPSPETPPTC